MRRPLDKRKTKTLQAVGLNKWSYNVNEWSCVALLQFRIGVKWCCLSRKVKYRCRYCYHWVWVSVFVCVLIGRRTQQSIQLSNERRRRRTHNVRMSGSRVSVGVSVNATECAAHCLHAAEVRFRVAAPSAYVRPALANLIWVPQQRSR